MELEKYYYNNTIVRNFAYATILWGVVGLLAGVWIALQLVFPELNFGIPYTTFSRLRPLHTNAVIFAFVGNGIFTGVYYSVPRLVKARMFSDMMGSIHFWGWQLIIVAAALTLPFGITSSREYAELEWPIDIAIAVIWVIFGINMMMTLVKRRTSHIYVAIWFYIATWVTVAVLHVVNNLEIPVSIFKSYPIYAGVQDALVQWWYGHNAVAFFLTTPYLGIMYYFMPKAANRPVYSYRLSIIHFWALIFIYIWAGPHHLLYTALPDWAQSLGTVFSIMLIAPSWGGMLNGLLTLRGAWDRVRDSATLKFMVVAITAYGMSTFEGPMMSIKAVNALTHYTDWTIGHVHIGTLGWNGFLTFGMLYWLLPRLFRTKLYSDKLANIHFWVATLGIIFYAVPLYWAGIAQTLMWKEFTADGFLKYPNFLETVTQILPMYGVRAIGGVLYFVGVLVGVYNYIMTMKQGDFLAEEEAQAAPRKVETPEAIKSEQKANWHSWFERRPVQMAVWATVAILIGALVELIPTFMVKSNIPTIATVKPYTPLELEGRDIYVREGCYTCHSQMVRPFRSETERYGEYSKPGEFIYDRPFQWGSKRTGPDLHREGVVGGKMYKTASWHYNHMLDPQKMNAKSIMPPYPWMITDDLDISDIEGKLSAMQMLGVPYTDEEIKNAKEDLMKQASKIEADLKAQGIKDADKKKEIVALIAYLMRLGSDISEAK